MFSFARPPFLSAPVAQAHDVQSELFPAGYWGKGLVSCTGDGKGGDRCDSFCDVVHTGTHIAYFGLTILLYVLVPAMIMWGGILYLTAGASSEQTGKAKTSLRYALIGLGIGLFAYLILETFFGALGLKDFDWKTGRCDDPAFNIFNVPDLKQPPVKPPAR